MIDPEIELDSMERSDLAQVFNGKGWGVIVKILRIIVEEARVAVDNAQKDEDVLSAQKLSRASGIIVTKFLTRVSNEVAASFEAKKAQPQDSAPGLEMDNIEDAVKDLPNLLGEVYITEDDDLEEGR